MKMLISLAGLVLCVCNFASAGVMSNVLTGGMYTMDYETTTMPNNIDVENRYIERFGGE